MPDDARPPAHTVRTTHSRPSFRSLPMGRRPRRSGRKWPGFWPTQNINLLIPKDNFGLFGHFCIASPMHNHAQSGTKTHHKPRHHRPPPNRIKMSERAFPGQHPCG
jgi:hypothetical protein